MRPIILAMKLVIGKRWSVEYADDNENDFDLLTQKEWNLFKTNKKRKFEVWKEIWKQGKTT